MYVSNISTATEHTEPNINAATKHIRIGPCILHWSQVSNLELGVLRNLHLEIQDRNRMPVSSERFFASVSQDDRIMTQSRSWSGTVEAIARCVAAFQNATDATEPLQCNEITGKLCSYASALAQRTSPYLREHFLVLLYEYIQNRTYDLALKNMVNRVFVDIEDGFWSGLSERQRSECLTLIEICTTAVTQQGHKLRHEMASFRLCDGSSD